jgi:hypothetical protein
MSSRHSKFVLRCRECDCRAIEVRGTLVEDSVVLCVDCGTELGRVPDVIAELQTRVERQIDQRRKRRLH